MSNLPPKPELRTSADPTVLRVIPELAKEIGTNESMILLQLAYWIKISPNSNYRDGRWWTYQSLRDMEEKAFSFLSYSTIRRALKDLEEAGYIIVADHYNEHRYDRTKWYALNLDRLQGLPCISVIVGNQEYKPTPETEGVSEILTGGCFKMKHGGVQDETGSVQNETGNDQDETTIPETTTETTTEKTLSTHFGVLKFGDFQFDEDTEFILVNAQIETREDAGGDDPVEGVPSPDAADEGAGADSVEDAGEDTNHQEMPNAAAPKSMQEMIAEKNRMLEKQREAIRKQNEAKGKGNDEEREDFDQYGNPIPKAPNIDETKAERMMLDFYGEMNNYFSFKVNTVRFSRNLRNWLTQKQVYKGKDGNQPYPSIAEMVDTDPDYRQWLKEFLGEELSFWVNKTRKPPKREQLIERVRNALPEFLKEKERRKNAERQQRIQRGEPVEFERTLRNVVDGVGTLYIAETESDQMTVEEFLAEYPDGRVIE